MKKTTAERTYTTVMYDIAVIAEEEDGGWATIDEDAWPALIRELAELPEDQYRHSLTTLRTLNKIGNLAKRFVTA